MLRYCSYPCEVVGFNNSDFEDASIQVPFKMQYLGN